MKLLAEDTDYDYFERYVWRHLAVNGEGDGEGGFGIGDGIGDGDLISYKARKP